MKADRLARTAHLHMLAIDVGFRGRGVATALVNATVDNARIRGFDVVLADATNPTSTAIFARAGFDTVNEVRYGSFAFEGAKPFAGLEELGGIKLMERRD